jgi:hypothetical protein
MITKYCIGKDEEKNGHILTCSTITSIAWKESNREIIFLSGFQAPEATFEPRTSLT